jgi:hypothetical protein
MVLGTDMSVAFGMKIRDVAYVASGLLACVACTADQKPPDPAPMNNATRAEFAALQIHLVDRKGRCMAVMQNRKGEVSEQTLLLPWPCRFHLDITGQVRSVSASDWRYAIVESEVSSFAPRLASEPEACRTRLQSLRFKTVRMETSPHTECVASSPPFQWDSFVFKALFD